MNARSDLTVRPAGVVAASGDTSGRQPRGRDLGAASGLAQAWVALPPQGLLHTREPRPGAQCSLLISSVIISRAKENQLCLFTFLGDQAIWRSLLPFKGPRGSGTSIFEDADHVGNSHSSTTLAPGGYP